MLDGEGWLKASIGSFLLSKGERIVRVDLGLGPANFELPAAARYRSGALLESPNQHGIGRRMVSEVFYTHLHDDHLGWTVFPGADALSFPNARHLVNRREWLHWSTAGHTPGHLSLAVESMLGPMLLLGDVVHHEAQLAEPEIAFRVDDDVELALNTGKQPLRRAADSGEILGFGHFSGQQLGRVHAQREGFSWAPLDRLPG
nr:MBL fold metallo-hydrolase [Psychromicrobium silvestre]